MLYRHTPLVTDIVFRAEAFTDAGAMSGSIFFGLGEESGSMVNATIQINIPPNTNENNVVTGTLNITSLGLVQGQAYNVFTQIEAHGLSGSAHMQNRSVVAITDRTQYAGSGSAGNIYVNFDNTASTAPDGYLYYHHKPFPTVGDNEGHWLKWDNTDERFEFSTEVNIPSILSVGAYPALNNGKIVGLSTPTLSHQAATKSYVDDNVISGSVGTLQAVTDNGNTTTNDIKCENLYINQNGPDGDSFVYFYDQSSQTGVSLKWDNTDTRFEFSTNLYGSGDIRAASNVIAGTNMYINFDGGDGNSYLYFYEGGSSTGASLYWNDAQGRFQITDGIRVEGHIYGDDNIFINTGGPDGDSFLYFYENSSNTGAYLKWDDTPGEFVFNQQLSMATNKIVDVVDPTSDQDAATKKYVDDNAVSGSVGTLQQVTDEGNTTTNTLLVSASGSTFSSLTSFGDGHISEILTAGTVRSNGDIYVDYNGPDGDSFIYFYDSSSPTTRYLKWEENATAFEFSDILRMNNKRIVLLATPSSGTDATNKDYVDAASGSTAQSLQGVTNIGNTTTKDIIAANLKSNTDIYVNFDGGEGDSTIYFYNAGSSTGASLMWDDSHGFRFSNDVYSDGHVIAHSNVYVNYNGGDGDSFLYFYEGGSPTGRHLKWDDGDNRFEMNDDLYLGANDLFCTQASINFDNANADAILFFGKPSSGFQSLKWDKDTTRFEFDDNLYVNGEIDVDVNHITNVASPSGSFDAANKSYVDQNFKAMKEPTGFPNRTDSSINFSSGSRVFEIEATGSTFDYYIKGEKFTISGSSVKIGDVAGAHYIYLTNAKVLVSTTSFVDEDIYFNNAYVTALRWNITSGSTYVGDERHGLTMDGQTHHYHHDVVGTRYESGLALNTFDSDGSGNDATAAQFGYTAGTIWDDDIEHDISADTAPANIPVLYRTSTTDWSRTVATDYPLVYGGHYDGTRIPWNEFTGGAWKLTEAGNLQFVLTHYFATNDVDNPIIGVCGQAVYTNVLSAREGATTELNALITAGLPLEEFKAIATVIFQTGNGYNNTPKARIRTTDTGDDYIDWRFSAGASSAGSQINDHSQLTGLDHDDHAQYSLVDGTRAYTGVVSGITPVSGSDLATKDYVDAASGSASPLTTKGDIYTYDTADARLPIGTNGQRLIADDTETLGIRWGGVANVQTNKFNVTTKTEIVAASGSLVINVLGISMHNNDITGSNDEIVQLTDGSGSAYLYGGASGAIFLPGRGGVWVLPPNTEFPYFSGSAGNGIYLEPTNGFRVGGVIWFTQE